MNRSSPTRRIVLLGSSNLLRGMHVIIPQLESIWTDPLDLLAALGHGRSYGKDHSVLGRKLPGILPCGLWSALTQRPEMPTVALLTDIGNDILYGESVETILQWIGGCLDRLLPVCSTIVMTRLPIASLQSLSPSRFTVLRRCLFPSSTISFQVAIERAEQLDQGVSRLAESMGVKTSRPDAAWFGFDPIHIKYNRAVVAWQQHLKHWSVRPQATRVRGSKRIWLRVRCACPEVRSLCGIQQRKEQPSIHFANGTRLSLF